MARIGNRRPSHFAQGELAVVGTGVVVVLVCIGDAGCGWPTLYRHRLGRRPPTATRRIAGLHAIGVASRASRIQPDAGAAVGAKRTPSSTVEVLLHVVAGSGRDGGPTDRVGTGSRRRCRQGRGTLRYQQHSHGTRTRVGAAATGVAGTDPDETAVTAGGHADATAAPAIVSA